MSVAMMKKAQAPMKAGLSMRHVMFLGWRLVILVSIVLCVIAFLRIQHYSQSTVAHSSSLTYHFSVNNPKIAFLFLVRRNLPLDFLWESFFESADKPFSIYIHCEPGYVFDESTTSSAIFFNRQLRNTIKVAWGEASMIQAERILFEEALQDPANEKFVLLSDSCVPLYNFSYIYDHLMGSPRSFVDSFLDNAKDPRYNPKMSSVIPKQKWRKGSQWVALTRRHAKEVVNDEIVFPTFKKFCKRRPAIDPKLGKKNIELQKQHNCIPDEHYVQTLLAMKDLESELERRTVTYTLWKQPKSNMDIEGWHPFTFNYADAAPHQIKKIMDINQVYYETEYRTEHCSSNSTSVPCFLFARKFSEGAAMRLLSQGVFGNIDVSAFVGALH